MLPLTQVIGGKTSPEKRQRIEWGAAIREAMETLHLSRKDLVHRLRTEYGITVSNQAVSYWLNGTWKPSERHQAALADLFGQPSHRLFPPLRLERGA